MPVLVETAGGCNVSANICDLSRDGFGLTSESLFHAGQSIIMHLPRETVTCELRWVDGHRAGGIFREHAQLPQWR
jgi:hypothetical protein